ncbi:MAG: hypothetical protein HKN37_00955 [Rhodothermales bacterium]|nr:hypothetical protein [Rhodothermales bacterium]
MRERRGIPLSRIHEETRISADVLKEFESTALVGNQLFNRVYLRSLVISYARIVGTEERRALEALEAALAGKYEGGLNDETGDSSREPLNLSEGDQLEAPDDGNDEGSDPTAMVAEERTFDQPPPIGDMEGPEDDSAHSSQRVANRFEFLSSAFPSKGEPRRNPNRVHREISTAVHDFKPPEDLKGMLVRPNRFRAIALTSLVVIVSVSAIVAAIRLSERPSDKVSPMATDAVESSATTPVLPLPPSPISLPPPFVVGDSIAVTIVATAGPLDPVRIQLDRDLRRPYWVDEGDSMTFSMRQRIVFEDLLDRATIKLEGVPYPAQKYRDRERLELTRDSVHAFVESLQSR